uniref:Uncharacterized protein n=1 Tax=Trichogramma kaykai TaxID=54128 RepID=A0ABD2XE00_9HYME
MPQRSVGCVCVCDGAYTYGITILYIHARLRRKRNDEYQWENSANCIVRVLYALGAARQQSTVYNPKGFKV